MCRINCERLRSECKRTMSGSDDSKTCSTKRGDDWSNCKTTPAPLLTVIRPKGSLLRWLGGLDGLIDDTTQHLRQEGEFEHDLFLTGAKNVTQQIRAAGTQGGDLDQFTDKVYRKIASYGDAERREWEGVFVSEIEKNAAKRTAPEQIESSSAEEGDNDIARPPMPTREFSSRATNIQRLLHEADGVFPPGEGPAAERTRVQQGPAQDTADSGSAPSRPRSANSDTDSWEQISPPSGERSITCGAPIAAVPSLQPEILLANLLRQSLQGSRRSRSLMPVQMRGSTSSKVLSALVMKRKHSRRHSASTSVCLLRMSSKESRSRGHEGAGG